MALTLKLEGIADLPHAAASDIKTLGWRGVMRALGATGSMVVTNHRQPEAVILSAATYGAIVQALEGAGASHEAAIDALRRRFDERLRALDAPEARERFHGLMDNPIVLGGKVKAGDSH